MRVFLRVGLKTLLSAHSLSMAVTSFIRNTYGYCKKHNVTSTLVSLCACPICSFEGTLRDTNSAMATFLTTGQHSLTSVKRPCYLRSDFVNVWCHARLVVYISCDSCMLLLRSSTLICLLIWCLYWDLVLLFWSSLDWFNQEDATASVWKWCFNVSPRSSLLAHGEGLFSGCYWVTSIEWPRIEWYSRRITQTSK